MKLSFFFLFLALCSLQANLEPSWEGLERDADLVAVIEPKSKKEAVDHKSPKADYQAHSATCNIVWMIKGPKDMKTIELVYFLPKPSDKLEDQLKSLHAYLPKIEVNQRYLVFLTKDKAGVYTPVINPEAARWCIKPIE
jgi:hypothetical protein